ncbi:MAG: class I adenylate-forming enzyme family protein [Bacillota bacterium]|nr:class I adenylate-forming enzyme family protein [Bacillota bacterium]
MMFYDSIVENLARNALKNPDRLCLADEKKSLTYKEVWDSVCGLAMEFDKRGVTRESRVIVECNQSVDYMVCDFAVQLLKGIFVPLEKNAAVSRIMEIASETEAVIHVGPKSVDEFASHEETKNIGYMDIKDACSFALGSERDGVYYGSIEDLDVIDFPKREDVAEILFSTGTTGKSKGIVLTHGNNIAIAENVCCGVKMKPENVEMIPMPTSHSHGLRRTYANMANGSSVVFVDNIMLLKRVFSMMDEYGVTSMDLSPSMLTMIFKLSKDRLGDYADVMDYIQIGSAPLPEDDKLHISRILPKTRLYNFYGSTEAGCSCLMDFNEAPGKKGCIGKPAVNAHFIVVDENRNEIKSSIDNLGFLASSGAINMKEYFKAPELTKEAMPDGDYIYTKDMGYIDEDGFVYMLGRKDDVINFGGIKISPEEIESQVIKNEWIRDCACIPVKDAMTGQAPKLFIALEPEAAGEDGYNEKAFRAFLAKALDANKQPKLIEVIDDIPRTFNGKIKRNELIKRSEGK